MAGAKLIGKPQFQGTHASSESTAVANLMVAAVESALALRIKFFLLEGLPSGPPIFHR
jgi:hypothetical protein